MATDLTPDDAVQAIRALTRVLETLVAAMRWHFWLLAVLLMALGGMFVVVTWTHAIQNDALRLLMQENRAIFQRLTR